MKNTYNLRPFLIEALEDLKFKDYTEIQEKVIPKAIKGMNIIGQSRTGSGKTHAFLLPVINNLDINSKYAQVVIATPTRELSQQVYEMAKHLTSFSEDEIRIKLLSGGTDRKKEMKSLENQQPHIVIGTPGKIADLAFKESVLIINKVKTLIIDEADMTLESGFLEEIGQIESKIDSNRNLMVFSATFPEQLKQFIAKHVSTHEYIKVGEKEHKHINIKHEFIYCKNGEKLQSLSDLIKTINPYLALIFVNTKEMADQVANGLKSARQKVAVIHGGLDQRARARVMNRVRNLEFQFVVATDLAARGIDIPGVSHVINYELPRDLDFYTHRSGRTGRVDQEGICYTLYDNSDELLISKLLSRGIEIEYKALTKNGLETYKNRKIRADRTRPETPEEKTARKMVVKPKKVKPGYKKKYNEEVKNVAKKIKHSTKKGRRSK